MISQIKKFFSERSKNQESRRLDDIKSLFYITEAGGFIYIMCNGVAIKKMDKFSSTTDVINSLDECRNCAVTFYKHQ